MAKGMTQFVLRYRCNDQQANQIVQNFLFKEGFQWKDNYWYYNDPILFGKAGLTYTLGSGQVVINGWVGKANKPMQIDDSFFGCLPKDHFKDMMNALSGHLNV